MDEDPDQIQVRKMMHHLIEPEGDPVGGFALVVEAAEVAGAGFDAVHDKMDHEVDEAEPPGRWARSRGR